MRLSQKPELNRISSICTQDLWDSFIFEICPKNTYRLLRDEDLELRPPPCDALPPLRAIRLTSSLDIAANPRLDDLPDLLDDPLLLLLDVLPRLLLLPLLPREELPREELPRDELLRPLDDPLDELLPRPPE
jgi:hypothetical protein